jgi:hypothetical protein
MPSRGDLRGQSCRLRRLATRCPGEGLVCRTTFCSAEQNPLCPASPTRGLPDRPGSPLPHQDTDRPRS